jgi:hypothetical protein
MKVSLLKRILFYIAILVAIGFSVIQLDFPKVRAQDEGGGCCTWGEDCPRFIVCCYPSLDQAPCSPSKHNYCMAAGCVP